MHPKRATLRLHSCQKWKECVYIDCLERIGGSNESQGVDCGVGCSEMG